MAKEKYNDEDGVWRTIGGRRVFIRKGQSVADAMIESGKFSKKGNMRSNYRKEKEKDYQEQDELYEKYKNAKDENVKDEAHKYMEKVRDNNEKYEDTYEKRAEKENRYAKVDATRGETKPLREQYRKDKEKENDIVKETEKEALRKANENAKNISDDKKLEFQRLKQNYIENPSEENWKKFTDYEKENNMQDYTISEDYNKDSVKSLEDRISNKSTSATQNREEYNNALLDAYKDLKAGKIDYDTYKKDTDKLMDNYYANKEKFDKRDKEGFKEYTKQREEEYQKYKQERQNQSTNDDYRKKIETDYALNFGDTSDDYRDTKSVSFEEKEKAVKEYNNERLKDLEEREKLLNDRWERVYNELGNPNTSNGRAKRLEEERDNIFRELDNIENEKSKLSYSNKSTNDGEVIINSKLDNNKSTNDTMNNAIREKASKSNTIPRDYEKITYTQKIDTNAGKKGDKFELYQDEDGRTHTKNLRTGETYQANMSMMKSPEAVEINDVVKKQTSNKILNDSQLRKMKWEDVIQANTDYFKEKSVYDFEGGRQGKYKYEDGWRDNGGAGVIKQSDLDRLIDKEDWERANKGYGRKYDSVDEAIKDKDSALNQYIRNKANIKSAYKQYLQEHPESKMSLKEFKNMKK